MRRKNRIGNLGPRALAFALFATVGAHASALWASEAIELQAPAEPAATSPSPTAGTGTHIFRTRTGPPTRSQLAPLSNAAGPNGIPYLGGPVLHGVVDVYFVWYGNWARSPVVPILRDLAASIGDTRYFEINTTYRDTLTSAALDVTFVKDTVDSYSHGTSLDDNAVHDIVAGAIESGALPADTNGVYFVLASSDVKETTGMCSVYCGWHGTTAVGDDDIKVAFIGNPDQCPDDCEVSNVQNNNGPNGNSAADGMASVFAHELSEATTDPDLNAWVGPGETENADKCAWNFGPTYAAANGHDADVRFGDRDYYIQQMWMNEAGGACVMRLPATSQPKAPVTVVSRIPSHMDLFVVGNDGAIYTSWTDEGFGWPGMGGWRQISPPGTARAGQRVAAVARDPGKLDVFVTGNDGGIWTSWWQDGSDWSGLNGWELISTHGTAPLGASVAAVSRNPGQIDLFVSGNEGGIWTSWWAAGSQWSGLNGWELISTHGTVPVGAAVTAVSRDPNKLDLFVTGNEGGIWTSWWAAGSQWSGFNGWELISTHGTAPPGEAVAAVSRDPNKLDLFITGNEGGIWTSWWAAGSPWSGFNGWELISTHGTARAGEPVTAISRDPNKLDLFITGNEGGIWTSWWAAGSPWSGFNGWELISTHGTAPLGAPLGGVARDASSLDVFVAGNDGAIWTSSWEAGGNWTGLNGWQFISP